MGAGMSGTGGIRNACKCESFAVMMVIMPTSDKHSAPPPSLPLPLQRPASMPLPAPGAAAPGLSQRPRWSSRTLLAGNREVEIEHESVVYRLQLTSLGKLILTK
jgi:hemin uptake protein HemP